MNKGAALFSSRMRSFRDYSQSIAQSGEWNGMLYGPERQKQIGEIFCCNFLKENRFLATIRFVTQFLLCVFLAADIIKGKLCD